jgi:hypothetical protein
MDNGCYVAQRDVLIPAAEKYAYQKTSHLDQNSDEFRCEWNRIFHRRMNLLADIHIYGRTESQWRDWT